MTFKPKIWFPIAVVLSAINLGAVWFAAVPAQPLHATVHAVLALGFGLWAQKLRRGPAGTDSHARLDALEADSGRLAMLEGEMGGLQQALDETQERLDFAERLLAQHPEARRMDPPR
jgi:hypothetical protein